uniref:Large ribosomal subunit protein uL10 n=1 Tax=Sus scrofa TaxID=9823 RepID=A0A8D0Z1H1_PIG
MPLSPERKTWYFERLKGLLDNHTKIFLVQADNVGSSQMAKIRFALRGTATVLMGKNTMIRKIISTYVKDHPGHPFELLLPKVVGNIGFIFTNGELGAIRDVIEEHRVPAPARVGSVAPTDVKVPPGPTGCDPGQTSFFQVLQVPTKITKGQIEITFAAACANVAAVSLELGFPTLASLPHSIANAFRAMVGVVIEGCSTYSFAQADTVKAILALNIRPFTYGLMIDCVYDNGSVFDAAVLDLTDADMANKFAAACANVAAVSLELGFPTLASLPHSIANAFRAMVGVVIEGCSTYSFAQADTVKAILADPSAFAAASGGGDGGAAPAAAAAAVVEEEEEDEVDMGGAGGMFGEEEAGDGDY